MCLRDIYFAKAHWLSGVVRCKKRKKNKKGENCLKKQAVSLIRIQR